MCPAVLSQGMQTQNTADLVSVGQPKSNIDQEETRKHHIVCALFITPFKFVSWSAAGRGGLNSGLVIPPFARLFSSEGKFEYTVCFR
jgi:hypothetical protein